MRRLVAILLALSSGCWAAQPAAAAALECTNWQQAHPEWLWCDDFESDAALEQDYFDVERPGGRLDHRP